MAEYSAYASLSGFLKERVIDKIQDVIPTEDTLSRMLPLPQAKGTQVGKQIVLPVEISPPQGITFGGSDSTAFALQTPVSEESDQAILKTSAFAMNGKIAQDMIDRMRTNSQSVIEAFALKIKGLTEQAMFAQEVQLHHGSRGIGKIKAQTDDSGTTQTYSITQRTWAPAIWQRLLGATVHCYNGASLVTTTTACTVAGYSLADHTVTFTGTEADMDNFAAGYDFHINTGYGNEMQGLGYIAGSTASTIHGIDQSSVYAWQSNKVDMDGEDLSYDAVTDGIVALRNRGCRDNLVLLLDPISRKRLKNELLAAVQTKGSDVRFDSKTGVLGYDEQDIKLAESIFMWPGEAIMFDMEILERVGKGLEFVDLGGGTKNYVMALEGYNGAYCRVNWNQALFCRAPNRVLKFDEIGSSTA